MAQAEETVAPAGGSFLSYTPGRVFAPERFDQTERLIIETALRFSRKEVLPAAERIEAKEEGLMQELIRMAGELGLCGIDGAEEHGGLGLSKSLAARCLEMLSLDGSFAVTYGVTTGIARIGISLFGTEEQRAKYLPGLTSGEVMGAYALSEPNSGSDALSLATTATRTDDGWRLDGDKMWISNAKWAGLFIVMAKGENGISAFLVERDAPGVSIGREEDKLGLRGSSTARLILDGALVPADALLYEEGKGHYLALNSLNIGRFKLAAMALGPARHALHVSSRYAKERKQFGKPIAEFGLVRQKFAEMLALYFMSESALYRTAGLVDSAFERSDGSWDGNRRAAEEYSVECSCIKVFASEAEATIADEALQVFGGYGYTEEFPAARIYRDARVSRIYEGTSEINRVFIASRLQKWAGEGRISLETDGGSWLSEMAARAMRWEFDDQIKLGAASDLALLAYVEQSSRLRAQLVGGIAHEAHKLGSTILGSRAALAWQRATGEAVSIPGNGRIDYSALSDHAYESGAPLGG